MRCIITGCALVAPDGRWVSGDLFDTGDDYVFNGNFDHVTQSVDWVEEDVEIHYGERLFPDDWWERRGVFVIRRGQANLNDVAKEYIGE